MTHDVESSTTPNLNMRAQAKRRTRQVLLDAAQSLFVSDGYVGATIDKIAAQVDLTKGAVYAHFASKEELFLALLDHALEQQVAELHSILSAGADSSGDWRNGLIQWLDRLDNEAPINLPLLGLELQIESRRNAHFAKTFTNVINAYRQALQAVIEVVFKRLRRKPTIDPEKLTGTIIAIAEGLALARATNIRTSVASTSTLVQILLGLEDATLPTAKLKTQKKKSRATVTKSRSIRQETRRAPQ